MTSSTTTRPEAKARARVKDLTDLLWHIGVFVIVNAFLWIQDFAAGGGLDYAYWTTIPWGVGLALHVASFLYGGRRYTERKYQEYLAEEQERDPRLR